MKKLMSILTALTTIIAFSAVNADAADFSPPEIDSFPIEETQESTDFQIPYVYCDEEESNGMKNAGNPDLAALAKSLGADTDYFQFANNIPEKISDEIFAKFCSNLKKLDVCFARNDRAAYSAAEYGMCYGISMLEILNHNGVISPSDIQSGAKTLHDITYDKDVNDILCYYN